tara:strand:+ start:2330 stop:2701 length:372 start_codon:yes stop_codon:yes gene_type:complete
MKKDKKKTSKKENNIIPFKKNAQVIHADNPVSTREKEINKINSHCRKIFKDLEDFGDTIGISSSEVWYNILFFAKQRAIYCVSYPTFKINDQHSTNEVTENYVEFSDENFPELKVDYKPTKLH